MNCFEGDISQDDLLQFAKSGYHAFLDYASLHWFHHLEIIVTSLMPEDLVNSTDLSMAIDEFFEMYQLGKVQADKIHKEYMERCSAIYDAELYEQLLSLLTHAKTSRIAEEKLEALCLLRNTIRKIRNILEELDKKPSSTPSTTDPLAESTKENLAQFYSDKWFKCSRHACYYFDEGFPSEQSLTQYMNRHDKPFCCTEISCTRLYIRWSTTKELKNHMSQYHPDPEAFSWKFPYVKKPPSKY